MLQQKTTEFQCFFATSRVVGLTRSILLVRRLPPGFLTLITNLVPILLSHSCAALVVGCLNFNLRVVLLLPVGGKRQTVNAFLQLSATDVSAQTTMKGAAKCDKHCDLQNSVNQQIPERILRFRDTPESMPTSVSSSVSCC